MKDILIVEDNIEIAELLKDFLEKAGYKAVIAISGEEALSIYNAQGAKLVILDIMLPGMDGFLVCKTIREKSNTPIIIVSAKDEKEDKLNGLLLGADDYIEKPYDIDILIAKIDGIFKRRYGTDIIKSGDIELNKVSRIVYKNGSALQITSKEFELLLLFMENIGSTLSKDMIFNRIWGFDSYSEQQTLTVHIKWLREKIEDNVKSPKRIVTVWGVGYRFQE